MRCVTAPTAGAMPAQAHIQTAERIAWMTRLHELPEFNRYPPPPG